MKEFKSAFKPAIEEYLEFRSAMGYCNEHEQHPHIIHLFAVADQIHRESFFRLIHHAGR